MIISDDKESFADMSTADLVNQISVLHGEVEYAKSQLLPHDTGHIHTAINWMQERIFQLEQQVRTLEAL